ncbi:MULTISPECIES: SDR family oxidoreductase [Deefgea]|uniref:NAD(P)H-binding protein n=1 Tax=Deefgea chitinilytica TaxID=570276 RepID=A0ABS2C7P7_9NEIS|nr:MULTISPECIES: SDR family oxidoreductase [Deefgea]MBM5570178.1 NAD(P)H-binding protein [Deefgea chitinilytica]MBM9887407.1 SDR family oxidoreductase [Deefgea sp. CFH1-16]
MHILILGGRGLIGAALATALRLRGHQVAILSRHASNSDEISANFADLIQPQDWLPHLNNVDVLVNAVGIFCESATQTFADLHVKAPLALFAACEQLGLKRVIQISALGAASTAITPYWRSKGEADEALMKSQLDWTIVRPSLIYSPNGTSSQVFCQIASLPLLPDLQGLSQVQPVHLDDVIALLVKLIEARAANHQIVEAVGATAMPLHQWWQALRSAMNMKNTISIKVYPWQQYLAMRVCQYMGFSLLNADSLAMLKADNTGDENPMRELLGRSPKAAVPDAAQSETQRQAALLAWLLPLLRWSLAAVWLLTAVVSWHFPRADSFALLGQAGMSATWQPLLFYGSVALDVAFGIACLLNRYWRWQIVLVLFYSVIIAIQIPEFLWHPFGPLLKNLPILALLLMLDQLKTPRHR